MDEKQLKDMLSAVKAPAPSETAKNQAFSAAMAVFDKKITADTQEQDNQGRPTGTSSTISVRRFLMQKRYVLSGVGGAVALTAMFVVLGAPFIRSQMETITRGHVGNVSQINSDTSVAPQNAGQASSDAQNPKKLQEQNRKLEKQAETAGASSVPVPIAPAENQTLALPATPPVPQADAQAEWRAKTEAKHAALEGPGREAVNKEKAEEKNEPVVQDGLKATVESGQARQAPTAAPQPVQKIAKGKDDLDRSAASGAPMSSNEAAKKLPAPGLAGRLQAQGAGVRPAGEADIETAPAEVPAASAIGGGVAAMRADKASIMPIPQPPVARIAPAPADTYDYKQSYYHDEGRDEFPSYDDNPVTEVSAAPVSTFSIDVDTSSYSLVRSMINGGHLPPKGAVRLEEMINYFPYSYALPESREEPFQPTVAVYDCPWKQSDKLVHIGIQGYDLAERPKSNLVFLIDTSGSMDEPNKLPLLISSFKLMLDSLKPDDMVGIVTYAGNAGIALEPTKASEKSKIIHVLDSLEASGSTAGSDGIRTAYELAAQHFIKGGNNRIILATDGDFNVGISDQDQLKSFIEKKRDTGIYLSTMGFGMGNYHDNTMQTLAQNGNGNAAYIDNLNEARKVLVEEAGSTLFTIAKDVKIQVEFNPRQVQEYRLIGYETRHLNREDFNNDKIDAGEIGAGHSVTAIYEITPVGATPLVDNLRYAPKDAEDKKVEEADKPQFSNELAFLKIRYKRPDENTSKLMTRPITSSDERKFDDLPDDIRFAAAVAGFGQLLRENKYTSSLTWNQVIDMASNARGKDEFGYRTEFVNLVRLAKSEAGAEHPQAEPAAPVRGRE